MEDVGILPHQFVGASIARPQIRVRLIMRYARLRCATLGMTEKGGGGTNGALNRRGGKLPPGEESPRQLR